jgi:polyisoprenoid-binding protein YceI
MFVVEKYNYISSSIHALSSKTTLVVVTKNQDVDKINSLINLNHIDFGENRVQEATQKWKSLILNNSKLRLHLIGKLQSNKAKDAFDIFNYIHTLDNAKLAEIEAANAKKAQIDKLLAEGKTAIDAKQFPTAKTKYEEVLKLDDKNAEAKEKLTLVEQKLAEEKANAEKIANAKKLVLEGDALAKTNKNAEAKVKYEEAQKLYDDPAVKAKIDALDAKLKSEAEKLKFAGTNEREKKYVLVAFSTLI